MQDRPETKAANDANHSLAAASAETAIPWGERFIAAISCASESDIDKRRLKQLLLIGLAILGVFEVAAQRFPIIYGPERIALPFSCQIVNLILVGGAIVVVSLGRIGPSWRWWTFSFCLILLANSTVAAVWIDNDDAILMTLFLMIVTSAVTIPWNGQWQSSLGIAAVIAFTVAALTGAVEDHDLQQWMLLAALVPFAITTAVLKEYHRRQQWLIADLGKSREAALSASKAKSEFLSMVSHEIRAPMNAMLGMAELLSESDLLSDQRHYLEVMSANGNALLHLINDILDLARIESGRMQIEKTEFDLGDLIEQTISTFSVSARGKGLELAAHIAPDVPDRLIGDPLRLRQILVNLLGNAIKFTELGKVTLEVVHPPMRDPGILLFTVADTGIGIAPDKLELIFASFTQADSSTTRKYGGSGLGLAIAERLATMMGGQISVQSEANQGSKFSFTVRFDLASKVIVPGKQAALSLNGHRLLVVDNNQADRLILREMMTTRGAEVGEAESAEQALAAMHAASASGKPFRIVLLDMRMDGLEVVQRIRDSHLPLEPVVPMLPSDDLKSQIERLHEFGLDSYLVKPITGNELFEVIDHVLEASNCKGTRPMPQSQPVKQDAGAAGNLSKSRLLLAEDSPDNRLVIAAFLRREPYDVDFAENGEIALDRFGAKSYDVVLMDIQMPVMDGLAATRLIRRWESQHGGGHTPVIALTASALEEDVRNAIAAGCDLHLAKPIKKLVLLEALRNSASLRRGGAAWRDRQHQ
jgi:signal transduction histidine kinase/CheY-like chemotaxis protein